MTEVNTEEKATERLLIVDGHVRPAPTIETGRDPITGATVITNEVHYAPRPVHLAVDPDTGIVYGGYAPHEALGIDPPDADQTAQDAQREYEEFRAWRASRSADAPVAASIDDQGDGA